MESGAVTRRRSVLVVPVTAITRLTVLIPEVEPAHWWQRARQNRRGAVMDRALRRHTDAVVRRLRMRS